MKRETKSNYHFIIQIQKLLVSSFAPEILYSEFVWSNLHVIGINGLCLKTIYRQFSDQLFIWIIQMGNWEGKIWNFETQCFLIFFFFKILWKFFAKILNFKEFSRTSQKRFLIYHAIKISQDNRNYEHTCKINKTIRPCNNKETYKH